VKAVRYEAHSGGEGCQYQSIVGIIFKTNGQPLRPAEAKVTAHIISADGRIDEFRFAGEQPRFGESAFESFVSNRPRIGDYTIQLLGPTGAPISDIVQIQTRDTCTENVLIIEFIQNHEF
jgi:hypothetical protein